MKKGQTFAWNLGSERTGVRLEAVNLIKSGKAGRTMTGMGCAMTTVTVLCADATRTSYTVNQYTYTGWRILNARVEEETVVRCGRISRVSPTYFQSQRHV